MDYNIQNEEHYIHELILKQRIYNGKIGVGSVLAIEQTLHMYENSAILTIIEKICTEASTKILSGTMKIEYPYSYNFGEKNELIELIENIQNNQEYRPNEVDLSPGIFKPKKFIFYDLSIDGENFEIPNGDKVLEKLLKLFHSKDALERFNIK